MQFLIHLFLHTWLDNLVSAILSTAVFSRTQGVFCPSLVRAHAYFQANNGSLWHGNSNDYRKSGRLQMGNMDWLDLDYSW